MARSWAQKPELGRAWGRFSRTSASAALISMSVVEMIYPIATAQERLEREKWGGKRAEKWRDIRRVEYGMREMC